MWGSTTDGELKLESVIFHHLIQIIKIIYKILQHRIQVSKNIILSIYIK